MRLVFISSVIATSALRTISAVIGSTAGPLASPTRASANSRPTPSPPGRGFKWGRCPVVCTVIVYSRRHQGPAAGPSRNQPQFPPNLLGQPRIGHVLVPHLGPKPVGLAQRLQQV